VAVVGVEVDHGALMDTGAEGQATITSFSVLFTASGLLESSSLHVAHHGILDEFGSFVQSKSRIISFHLRLIQGQISPGRTGRAHRRLRL